MEVDCQDVLINEVMKITKKTELEYNQTDVIICYFYGENSPVVYDCKDTSFVHVPKTEI